MPDVALADGVRLRIVRAVEDGQVQGIDAGAAVGVGIVVGVGAGLCVSRVVPEIALAGNRGFSVMRAVVDNEVQRYHGIASFGTLAMPDVLRRNAAFGEHRVMVRVGQLLFAKNHRVCDVVGGCHEEGGVRLDDTAVVVVNGEVVCGGGVKGYDSRGGGIPCAPFVSGWGSAQGVIPEQIVLQTASRQGDRFPLAMEGGVGQQGHLRHIHDQQGQGDGTVAAGLGNERVDEHRILFLYTVDIKAVTVVGLAGSANRVRDLDVIDRLRVNGEGESASPAGVGAGEGDEAFRRVLGEIDGHLLRALSRLNDGPVGNRPDNVGHAGQRVDVIVVNTPDTDVVQSVDAVHLVNVGCHQ